MKATLHFDLKEEYEEYKTCIEASDFKRAVREFDDILRNIYKHEDDRSLRASEVRDLLYEKLKSHDVCLIY